LTHSENARFAELWRDNYPPVLAYLARRAPDQARDLAADVFTVAWRRLSDVPEDPLPWLIGVARKVLANDRRAARRRSALRLRLATERAPLADDPAARFDSPDLQQAWRSLSARDRELLALLAWEGLTPAQAALVLGCSEGALAVRLHRARARLARALADPRPAGEPPTLTESP